MLSLPSAADDDAERIDFDHARVAFPPGLVNAHEQLHAAVEGVALQAERRSDLARLIRHDADGGINLLLDDLLGMLLGDFLDVHAAFGAGHDERARRGAIQQHWRGKTPS
jgi:hypothetical protein